jgi:hypothetical protein
MEYASDEKSIFLSGRWRHLAILNFECDPAILKQYLPYGTELDLYSGQAYISLVGFLFEKPRLWGSIKVPFHQCFEEVNLRFYVKRKENGEIKRGTVFIKEYVSKATIAMAANRIYKENYITTDMSHDILPGNLSSYSWGENFISVETDRRAQKPKPNSKEYFITQAHESWGFTRLNSNQSLEFQVDHKPWHLWLPNDIRFNVDVEQCYGIEFEPYISEKKLNSAYLVDGSDINVHFPTKIMSESIQ